MRICIIGSGNVAYHLAKAFCETSIGVYQIFGRNKPELKRISEELNIPFSDTEVSDADIYIICVKDDAISEVSKIITSDKALVAHTSGSQPKEILQGDYRKASFYPLQTFSKNKNIDYKTIPFFIEAESDEDFELITSVTKKISEKIIKSDYEKRKFMHLTAVFCCNFVNHLYARAKEISDSQNIPFDYFFPLIQETTEKIHQMDPRSAQTGPAVRKDERVLKLHEELITNPEQLEIYKLMNQSIKKMYGNY